jgi:hypothetical protein
MLPVAPLRPFVTPVLRPFFAPVTPSLTLGVEAAHRQAKRGHTGDQDEKTTIHGRLLQARHEPEHVSSQ